MVTFRVGYGKGQVEFKIPHEKLMGVIKPKQIPILNEKEVILEALTNPIGTERLSQLAKGKKEPVIVVSDVTRLLPTSRIFPFIRAELREAGLESQDLKVIVALGAHRQITQREKRAIMGEFYDEIGCIDAGLDGYVNLGSTSRGTPMEVCRAYAQSDLRIAIGNIELHRLAGYSGGAKAVCPGVASKEAITCNHSLSSQPGVELGKLEGNPVREDLEEFTSLVGLDFLFNVVVNSQKQILGAFAGDWVKAHRQGCRLVEQIYRIPIQEPAPIVVVSAGGTPKDNSVYQGLKCMLNALDALQPGGTVIVAAKCVEGFGDDVFSQWVKECQSPEEMKRRLAKAFVLGGHKTSSVLKGIDKGKIVWVSDLDEDMVRKLFFEPASCLQQAVDDALARAGAGAKAWVMPEGGLTVPFIDTSKAMML